MEHRADFLVFPFLAWVTLLCLRIMRPNLECLGDQPALGRTFDLLPVDFYCVNTTLGLSQPSQLVLEIFPLSHLITLAV